MNKVDAEQGAALDGELAAAGTPPGLWTTSLHGDARLCARELRYEGDGLAFDLVEGDASVPVRCRLIGRYNASNLLAVVGALRALGIGLAAAAGVLPALSPVPGRMQPVTADVDEFAWWRKTTRGGSAGSALIEHARRGQRGEHAGHENQLLDVRGAR